MINFIPIFPLDIIVYPGESLNLHVFEPRYKQLITECIEEKKPFGIPAVLNKKLEEYGTLMEITELVKEYDNGEMDVRTKGTEIFRVLEIIKQIPDKLYHGAIVKYPENVMEHGDTTLATRVISEVKRLYSLLNVESKFPEQQTGAISYKIAHFTGLAKEQEYELLCIFTELQRLEYLRRHLNNITPMLKELEEVKARIQMNGHFRNLSLGDLDL
ncbi:MAG TPA: LON peptidase substrate-binding domain-containing protein [Flavipsychrobacter sp.]|nr:LON peptidase substrate-binding domain-containing protein [Flavipsychrobacter sp.]